MWRKCERESVCVCVCVVCVWCVCVWCVCVWERERERGERERERERVWVCVRARVWVFVHVCACWLHTPGDGYRCEHMVREQVICSDTKNKENQSLRKYTHKHIDTNSSLRCFLHSAGFRFMNNHNSPPDLYVMHSNFTLHNFKGNTLHYIQHKDKKYRK